MRILFTTRDQWFSNTICELTGEPVSHVALEFPEHGFVVHSNIRGVHLQWAETFRAENIVVHELEMNIPDNFQRLGNLLLKHEFSYYDVGAILYLGGRLALRRHMKMPLAKDNLWQSTGMFLCTEWVTEYLYGEQDSLITPYKLYQKLVSQQVL